MHTNLETRQNGENIIKKRPVLFCNPISFRRETIVAEGGTTEVNEIKSLIKDMKITLEFGFAKVELCVNRDKPSFNQLYF